MTDFSRVPDVEHYAIITVDTTNVYHEGDERSRTNPGHGYPAYTETIHSMNYESFVDYEKFKKTVDYLTKTNKKFKIIKATPLKVTVETKIQVK